MNMKTIRFFLGALMVMATTLMVDAQVRTSNNGVRSNSDKAVRTNTTTQDNTRSNSSTQSNSNNGNRANSGVRGNQNTNQQPTREIGRASCRERV